MGPERSLRRRNTTADIPRMRGLALGYPCAPTFSSFPGCGRRQQQVTVTPTATVRVTVVHRNLARHLGHASMLLAVAFISVGGCEGGRCSRYHPDWHQEAHQCRAAAVAEAVAEAEAAIEYIPMTTLLLPVHYSFSHPLLPSSLALPRPRLESQLRLDSPSPSPFPS